MTAAEREYVTGHVTRTKSMEYWVIIACSGSLSTQRSAWWRAGIRKQGYLEVQARASSWKRGRGFRNPEGLYRSTYDKSEPAMPTRAILDGSTFFTKTKTTCRTVRIRTTNSTTSSLRI